MRRANLRCGTSGRPVEQPKQPRSCRELFYCAELIRFSIGICAHEFSAMADIPQYKFVDSLRPPCSKCRRPLVLTRIEPEQPGFDMRVYYCAACETNETIISPVCPADDARR